MSANIETMFYVREKPWHNLGTEVKEAPTSADALVYAGLDWQVEQKNVYAEDGSLISGYKVNIRSTDSPVFLQNYYHKAIIQKWYKKFCVKLQKTKCPFWVLKVVV